MFSDLLTVDVATNDFYQKPVEELTNEQLVVMICYYQLWHETNHNIGIKYGDRISIISQHASAHNYVLMDKCRAELFKRIGLIDV